MVMTRRRRMDEATNLDTNKKKERRNHGKGMNGVTNLDTSKMK